MTRVVNWEKCVDLANKRLRDVITAANKADACEMESLMMSSMCGDIREFVEPTYTEQTELTLNGDQRNGIYFNIQSITFHVTKDVEFNSNNDPDLYHIWCLCDYFDGKCVPMGHIHVNWVCGAEFLDEKHAQFLAGKITKQDFEQYIYDDMYAYCADWLKDNKDKVNV